MGPTWIGFHLTDRCQLDCQHCARDPGKAPTDLDVAVFEKVLDQASAAYGIKHVVLTGGEPTLHPRFADVVDAIAARKMEWHLVTNGGTFPKLMEVLAGSPARKQSLAYAALSLDGASEAVHDGIRGEGSFRAVLRAASLATFHGIPFQLKMTLHAKNAHELEAMGLLASQLGARDLSFAMFQATGALHDEALFLPAAEWHRLRARIERLAGQLTLPIGLAEGFPSESRFHVCVPFRSEQLHVDVRGRLTLCCAHSDQPGDGAEAEVAGDLGAMSLIDAHRRLLQIIQETQGAKLDAMAARAAGTRDGADGEDPWDPFPCNACMKHFGKPHWAGAGAGGPEARRERWRGAWDRQKQEAKRDGDVGAAERVRLRVVR